MRKITIAVFGVTIATVVNFFAPNLLLADAGAFYNGACEYRGFYWFEKVNQQKKQMYQNLTPWEATKAIEARKKALNDARNQMIELAFMEGVPDSILREAVIKYKKLEAKMFDGALRLVDAAEMANFVDPKLSNKDHIPTNVYANKIKRKIDSKRDEEIIRAFADNYDLILFQSDECPYSQAFLPIITNFVKRYSFNLEISDLNLEAGAVAQNMGIDVVPTVVAMSRDGKELFEINRGMNSISDLEHSILLADKYSREQRGAKNE